MNRVLAETLNFLNGIIAIVIVLASTLVAHRLVPFVGDLIALAIGFVIGIVIASLVCGMIAYVALIERHLAMIAGGSSRVRLSGEPSPHRQEPNL